MMGCMGATSKEVVGVEEQGYTIHMVVPVVFRVFTTALTSGVWDQPTLNIPRPRPSHPNTCLQRLQSLQLRRCPMYTNETRMPFTG
ncbi:hypothetical protein M0802_015445, partial [Mischocyttarus mexicanus]